LSGSSHNRRRIRVTNCETMCYGILCLRQRAKRLAARNNAIHKSPTGNMLRVWRKYFYFRAGIHEIFCPRDVSIHIEDNYDPYGDIHLHKNNDQAPLIFPLTDHQGFFFVNFRPISAYRRRAVVKRRNIVYNTSDTSGAGIKRQPLRGRGTVRLP